MMKVYLTSFLTAVRNTLVIFLSLILVCVIQCSFAFGSTTTQLQQEGQRRLVIPSGQTDMREICGSKNVSSQKCATELALVMASINAINILYMPNAILEYHEFFKLTATAGIESELGIYRLLLQKLDDLRKKYAITLTCEGITFQTDGDGDENVLKGMQYQKDSEKLTSKILHKKAEIYERLALMYAITKFSALQNGFSLPTNIQRGPPKGGYATLMKQTVHETFASNFHLTELLKQKIQFVQNETQYRASRSIDVDAIIVSQMADTGMKVCKGLAAYYYDKAEKRNDIAKQIEKEIVEKMPLGSSNWNSFSDMLSNLAGKINIDFSEPYFGGLCIERRTGKTLSVCSQDRSLYLKAQFAIKSEEDKVIIDDLVYMTNSMLAGDFSLKPKNQSDQEEDREETIQRVRSLTAAFEEKCQGSVKKVNASFATQNLPPIFFDERNYISLFRGDNILRILAQRDGPLKSKGYDNKNIALDCSGQNSPQAIKPPSIYPRAYPPAPRAYPPAYYPPPANLGYPVGSYTNDQSPTTVATPKTRIEDSNPPLQKEKKKTLGGGLLDPKTLVTAGIPSLMQHLNGSGASGGSTSKTPTAPSPRYASVTPLPVSNPQTPGSVEKLNLSMTPEHLCLDTTFVTGMKIDCSERCEKEIGTSTYSGLGCKCRQQKNQKIINCFSKTLWDQQIQDFGDNYWHHHENSTNN